MDKNSTILIVDDQLNNIKILAQVLQTDYRILFATNGKEAMDLALKELPDLILLDIIIPDMDGYQILEKIKSSEELKKIPVIFLTGVDSDSSQVKGFDLGAVDYITKPFHPNIVKARVKTHLSLKKAHEELAEKNVTLKQHAELRELVERISKHDLKGPLNTIIGFPSVFMSECDLDDDQMELLCRVKDAGYRMLEMINRSLDLFKMEQKKYRLKSVEVDLVSVFKRIIREQTTCFKAKKIFITMYVNGLLVKDDSVFKIMGEELICYSLFLNLLKNAAEASPLESEIKVEFNEREKAEIKIINNGTVPKKIRNNFFDKYSTDGKKDGTGLGTYSARLCARTLGGDILLETDDNINKTLLTITLPLNSLLT